MRYAFIRDHASAHRVTCLCTALGVSRSGYYAWRLRPLSARREADHRLLPVLRRLHRQTREQYGAVSCGASSPRGASSAGGIGWLVSDARLALKRDACVGSA